MWNFILFMRDGIVEISDMLDTFSFSFGGINVSLLDLFIGFVAMGLIITVFWKGARV